MEKQLKHSLWIISPFTRFDRSSNQVGRFLFIAQSASTAGFDVTFFTSKFDHLLKTDKLKPNIAGINFNFIYEPGYSKNVTIERLFSHVIFSWLLLVRIFFTVIFKGRPGSVYCAIPHNLAAVLVGTITRIFRIKFVVDVHDTWPENILSVYQLKRWQKPIFYSWKLLADIAISMADTVVVESINYAERANTVRRRLRQKPAMAIYLGGDINYYQEVVSKIQLPPGIEEGCPKFVYAGSLGVNYDLDIVIETFCRLIPEYPDARLVFLGGGERESLLRTLAEGLNGNIWFSGFIDHADLVALLRQMDYGLNSFATGGNVAYSYKLNDYLLAGLPVINSLSGESRELIRRHHMGFNYEAGNSNELLDSLRQACCYQNIEHLRENVRGFASENLDWHRTYQPIFNELMPEYCQDQIV